MYPSNDSRYLVKSLVHESMHPAYDESLLNGSAIPTLLVHSSRAFPAQLIALLCKVNTFSKASLWGCRYQVEDAAAAMLNLFV